MGALIGRTAALTALGRLVDAAVNGAGGLAFVTGDAGIGKTAVADEARRQAIGRGATVVWGTCVDGAGVPVYWPWQDRTSTTVDFQKRLTRTARV
jgi:predicted ATPase